MIASKIPVSYLPPPRAYTHTPAPRGIWLLQCWMRERGMLPSSGYFSGRKTDFLPMAAKKILSQISKCGGTHLRETEKEKLPIWTAFWGSTWSIYLLAQPHSDPVSVWQDALGGRDTLFAEKPWSLLCPCVRGQDPWHVSPLVCHGRSAHTQLQKWWRVKFILPLLKNSCSFLSSRARQTPFLLFQLITKAFIMRGLLQLVLK